MCIYIYVIYCGMWYNMDTICIKMSTRKQIDILRHTESSQTSLPTTIYAQQWSFVFWLHPLACDCQSIMVATQNGDSGFTPFTRRFFGIKSPNSVGKGPVFYNFNPHVHDFFTLPVHKMSSPKKMFHLNGGFIEWEYTKSLWAFNLKNGLIRM